MEWKQGRSTHCRCCSSADTIDSQCWFAIRLPDQLD
jgi:hypothetical protein